MDMTNFITCSYLIIQVWMNQHFRLWSSKLNVKLSVVVLILCSGSTAAMLLVTFGIIFLCFR